MKTTKKVDTDQPVRVAPSLTIEGREDRMIALAMDRAEEQLINGTASSQVICHYLRLGSLREKAELERIKQENELTKAKIKALEFAGQNENLYKEAIEAMRRYGGG